MSSYDVLYGINEAARISRVSPDTIRRRLRANLIPGAHRAGGRTDEAAEWRIPRRGLLSAGLVAAEDHPSIARAASAGNVDDASLAHAEADFQRRRADELAAVVTQQNRHLEQTQQALLQAQQMTTKLLALHIDGADAK